MSPEVILGNRSTPFKSEIWSFGCMLVEVVSQKRPWFHMQCDNIFQLMMEIGTGKDIPRIPNDLPFELFNFTKNCLNRDPEKRPSVE